MTSDKRVLYTSDKPTLMPSLPGSIDKYIAIKLESVPNKTQVARLTKRDFGLPNDVEAIRRRVRYVADKTRITLKRKPIRRLFFDIETSFCIGWFWRPGKQYVRPEQILDPTRIICICYKWQFEDKIHNLRWDKNQDDKAMIEKFVKVLGKADEIVAHNGDKFDMKIFRARAIKQRVLMFPKYRTLDTLTKARRFFSFPSNKLDYIGEYLELGRKVKHEGISMWKDIILHKDRGALTKMVEYCEGDVVLLEDVFFALSPYIDHNTNFAVLRGGEKWECPECSSSNVKFSHTDTTPMGYIKRHMKCKDCRKFYQISNRTYLRMLQDATQTEEK